MCTSACVCVCVCVLFVILFFSRPLYTNAVPASSTHEESNISDKAVSSVLTQTPIADLSKDASQLLVSPSLASSEEDRQIHSDTLPITLTDSADIPDDSNVFFSANDNIYSEGDMYPDEDDIPNFPETGSTDYIFLNLPEEDKRFMRGLKRVSGSSETSEDKRFMRGLNFKRDFDVLDGDEEDSTLAEKRFMRGFNKYAKKDDKRFMRGLRGSNFQDFADNDKRFMRGLRSVDYDNGEEKRFIVGLNRFARFDKRFMRGFGNYNKRFIHGLQNYGKRFMRGLTKRDQTAALDNEKRFIVGLNGYGRRANTLDGDGLGSSPAGQGMDKRFIKGLRPYTKQNHGKRFMKGFRMYSKKYRPVSEEDSNLEGNLSSDKRFMRGLTKKHFSQAAEEYNKQLIPGSAVEFDNVFDKRFIKGLGKKSDDSEMDKKFIKGLGKKSDDSDFDKRFMKGLGKKSDENEMDKRFIKGLGKKSDDSETDKRFIKGLGKKSDDSESEKRFIKGLGKKSDAGGEELDKRFIKGLVRKSEEDKRFMRGLHKKSDVSENNEFVSNDNSLDHPLHSFDNGKDLDEEELDKRFMRGFGKKNIIGKESQSSLDKRFMRGLYSKKESKGQNTIDTGKRFMRGFSKFSKKDNELTDDEMNNVDEEFSSFDNEQKRFIKGLTKKENKRFIKGLRNYAKKDNDDAEDSEVETDKRFMRGLVKKEDAIEDSQYEKRFIKGLVKKASYGEKQADTSVNDGFKTAAKNDSQMDKRFMRGLVKREAGSVREKRETEFPVDNDVDLLRRLTEKENYEKGDSLFETGDNAIWHDLPAYDSEFTHNKRFMRGLARYAKRDYDLGDSHNEFDFDHELDENQDISKRFMKGFLSHYNNGKRFHYTLAKPEGFDSLSGAEKRFIKGLSMYTRPPGKRFMRGLQQYGKRSYDKGQWEDKRFIRGLNPYIGKLDKRFMRGLGRFAKRPTDGDTPYSSESHQKLFPTHYLNLFPQHQLISPAYRHSQLVSLFDGDRNQK
ncbi:unnamed protein product [Candidula unifasciata]|uniref:Uncharacterized protein n=1 Tax=Candidula unifasciata TaxID=100452 RepID=A0A8S3Z990_9EUPU|nr:unnamed protein product [Candidula unifasciata]